MISSVAVIAFSIIFCGYIISSLFLQYRFYYRNAKTANSWKIQTRHVDNLGLLWGFPLFSSKPNRGPFHRFLVTFNLLLGSSFAAYTTESAIRGWNKMTSEDSPWSEIIIQLLMAVIYQSVAEYYWHRMMHWKYFYRYFHKFHHFYKSPEPFDDMYIHPVEAFGYYCILYGPPFLFRMHWYAFIGYMIIHGIFGVTDHSGIKIEIPLLYNTVDHDNHHAKFEVNYSFPFPFMDIIHGTYDGTYAGKLYQTRIRKSE